MTRHLARMRPLLSPRAGRGKVRGQGIIPANGGDEPSASILADEAHELALNTDAVGAENPRLISRIGSLQRD